VSALGHYLEEQGLATVAISLIRPQTEKTRPPRALWVPFELGRPLGPPTDPAFQRRVLLAALQLLERTDGPVLLQDFPDDDPRRLSDPAWQPPLRAAGRSEDDVVTLAGALAAEVSALQAAHRRWVTQSGRSTIGVSGLSIEDAAQYVAAWLRGDGPDSPRDGFSAPLLLRFAIDDLKAYALEAAAAGAAKPSSKQLGDWLWQETATGAAIQALRAALLHSEDQRLKLIAENFIVPGSRVRAAR
jgi:hypothetical protein